MTTLCPHCWGSKTEPGDPATPCGYCSAAGVVEDEQLTPHFKLSELWASDTALRRHIPNDPPPEFKNHLRMLAEQILEPMREKFGLVHVNSGFRSEELNASLHGSSKTSAHMQAWAVDIGSAGTATRKEIAEWLIHSGIDFDQVIFEGTWVHVGLRHPDGVTQRRQTLMMFPGPDGDVHYYPYDPNDSRVQ